MTPLEHQMLTKALENSEAALESSKRVEEWLFGTEEETKAKKPSRSVGLDNILFGVKVGRFSYRLVLGLAALIAAAGAIWANFKGFKS